MPSSASVYPAKRTCGYRITDITRVKRPHSSSEYFQEASWVSPGMRTLTSADPERDASWNDDIEHDIGTWILSLTLPRVNCSDPHNFYAADLSLRPHDTMILIKRCCCTNLGSLGACIIACYLLVVGSSVGATDGRRGCHHAVGTSNCNHHLTLKSHAPVWRSPAVGIEIEPSGDHPHSKISWRSIIRLSYLFIPV